jgi:hypothetical protein
MMDIELMHEYDREGLQFPEMALLLQLLVDRDWVWKLPAKYQREAVAYMRLGVVKPARKERPDVKPTIKIITRDGKIDRILTEGVIDVFIQDETGGTTAKYTTVDLGKYADDDEGDAAPDRCDSGDSSPPVGNA